MGLFKKKKEKYKISSYDQNQVTNKSRMTAFDKIKYETVKDSTDDTLFNLCDMILDGYPVLAQFEKVSLDEANRMLAFISGVVYATEGRIMKLDNKLFLMARREEFEDGSLYQYYEDNKR